MKNQEITLSKLFTTSLFISLMTIGSGFVAVPLYKRKLVEQWKLMDENEMMDSVTIAQCSPGAIIVNLVVNLGYKLAGLPGMAVMVLGTLLPPLLLMLLVERYYLTFIGNPYVLAVFRGMNAAVAAVLLNVVISMISEVKKHRLLSYLLLVLAFVLVFFFKISVAWVMLSGIVLAGILSWRLKE